MKCNTLRFAALASVSAFAFVISAPGAMAQTQQMQDLEKIEVRIPAQPLPDALLLLSEQADRVILASPELTEDQDADALYGSYTVPEALGRLLKSSGLKYQQQDPRTWLVTAQLAEAMGVTPREVAANNTSSEQRLIRVAQISEQDEEEPSADEDKKQRSRDEIVVTGTSIRGIAPESSPTRTFTREDVQISGAATAQEFIQALTTNFGGGSNADLPNGAPGDVNSQFNSGKGSSVNLRGLGSEATLVLLNGHRLAPSSSRASFTDISMIPASAIERVEILTDGASSVYGSDAVAGVVNFILRDDFEGVETSFRYGIGTEHRSAEEFRTGFTSGLNWNSGHALLSYEYFNQDEISATDRSFSQEAPGPQDLQPSQERHSVLGSISQNLTSNLEIFADLTFSRRVAERDFRTFFTGPAIRERPTSKNLNIATGGTWKVSDSWFVDFSGTFSRNNILTDRIGGPSVGDVGMSDFNSKIFISDMKTSGTVLRLPGGDLKLATGGHFRTEDFRNLDVLAEEEKRRADRDVYAAFGEAFIPIVGSDNAVPGIARLELNVSGRYDHYSDFGSTANPKVGVLWSPFESLNLRGSYSTSFSPPPLGRVAESELRVSAAETLPLFTLFGLTPADPSVADIVALYAFGTANNLGPETSRAFTAGLDFDRRWGRHKVAISTTWFDIDFENRLGQTPCPACANNNIFDAPNVALDDPGAFPEGTIIFSPTANQINDLVNSADGVTANIPPLFGDPFDAKLISFASVVRNLSLTLVSGLDFDVLYTFDTKAGNLLFGIDGTYLREFKQQAAETTLAVERISTLYNPVDLKLRARGGYAHDGLSAYVFVNYVNDYRLDNTADATRIGSWTTVDLSLSYDAKNRMGNSIFNNTIFRLSIINLFDEEPPSVPNNPSFALVGYDPTNSSALGRFISFELTKQF